MNSVDCLAMEKNEQLKKNDALSFLFYGFLIDCNQELK